MDAKFELRAHESNGKKRLECYFAVYGQESHVIKEYGSTFIEVLSPGCFNNALRGDPNVIFCVNHNYNVIYAQTDNGSLVLDKDNSRGLFGTVVLQDDKKSRDLWKAVKDHQIDECSFSFTVKPEGITWGTTANNVELRQINTINTLFEVSIVGKGAYPTTSTVARALDGLRVRTFGYSGDVPQRPMKRVIVFDEAQYLNQIF